MKMWCSEQTVKWQTTAGWPSSVCTVQVFMLVAVICLVYTLEVALFLQNGCHGCVVLLCLWSLLYELVPSSLSFISGLLHVSRVPA